MTIEDLIQATNLLIYDVRKQKNIDAKSYLSVLRRSEKASTFTGAIKTYTITIFIIKDTGSIPVMVFKNTAKVTTDPQESKVIAQLEEHLLQNWLRLIYNKETSIINQLIDNTYNGIINEQVSDTTD